MIGLAMMAAFSFLSGDDLFAACNDPAVAKQQFCTAYIEGAADGVRDGIIAADPQSSKTSPICVPSDITVPQMVDAVKKYMKDHPQFRSQSAGLSVFGALYFNWRCQTR